MVLHVSNIIYEIVLIDRFLGKFYYPLNAVFLFLGSDVSVSAALNNWRRASVFHDVMHAFTEEEEEEEGARKRLCNKPHAIISHRKPASLNMNMH